MIYNLINADGEIVSRIVVLDAPELHENKAHNDAERERYARQMAAYEAALAAWEATCEGLKAKALAKRDRDIADLEAKSDAFAEAGKAKDAIKAAVKIERLRAQALQVKFPPKPKPPVEPDFRNPEPYVLPEGHTLELAEG